MEPMHCVGWDYFVSGGCTHLLQFAYFHVDLRYFISLLREQLLFLVELIVLVGHNLRPVLQIEHARTEPCVRAGRVMRAVCVIQSRNTVRLTNVNQLGARYRRE